MVHQINFWNREKNKIEPELVYGETSLKWAYQTFFGKMLSYYFLSRSFISKIVGWYYSSGLSKKKIRPFCDRFKIQMEEYEDREYKNFNEFFIRKFKPEKRNFNTSHYEMPSPVEARVLAYSSVDSKISYPVKGAFLTPEIILDNKKIAQCFLGGPLIIARLCPTDYHRFHYPDDGVLEKEYLVRGALHSVNPVALQSKEDIFATNERKVSILSTKNFGKLAYVEVGAMCVGRIVQTHKEIKFNKGQEKGYFLFGGSSVLIFGQKEVWTPSKDLIEKTNERVETFIKIGSVIANRANLKL